MYKFHRYNLIRYDISSPSIAYKLFVRSLYDYAIVKEETSSGVTTRGYFVAAKGLETSWNNRASLTYSSDIKGRKLLNEGQSWLIANGGGESYSYLLDDYSGASAAYSLRKLNSSYSGDAIIVRRSSDNATQSIGFSDNILDTAALSTFCSGTNGFVATWFDQSGNGNNVTQTTASSQPKIYDNSTGVILDNGQAALEFNGTSNELVNTYLTGSTFSIVSIASSNNSSSEQNIYNITTLEGSFDSIVSLGYNRNASNQIGSTLREQGTSTLYQSGENLTDLSQKLFIHIGSVLGGAAFNNLYIDTNIVTQNIGSRATLEGGITIGSRVGNYFLNGKIQEFVMWESNQNTNRNGIEDNINNYYSIY